jgi:Nucleotidyl transferase AbiEii toxin, Type IV TA system
MGSTTARRCGAVSLDGLPADHVRVLLDGLPVFERHGLLLAGGYAFRAHEILHRPSQDLDFATREGAPLPEIAGHVVEAFLAAGYGVRLVEATGRYARLVLRLPGSASELEVDLLKEALGPGYVTVRVDPEVSVRALSLDDAVGLKARAWHDRFVIRDIIDLHAVAGSFSYADLESLARRHEPELDLETILDHLAGVSVFPDEDFAGYGLDEPTIASLRRWVTSWYDNLARRLAADTAGNECDDES